MADISGVGSVGFNQQTGGLQQVNRQQTQQATEDKEAEIANATVQDTEKKKEAESVNETTNSLEGSRANTEELAVSGVGSLLDVFA